MVKTVLICLYLFIGQAYLLYFYDVGYISHKTQEHIGFSCYKLNILCT